MSDEISAILDAAPGMGALYQSGQLPDLIARSLQLGVSVCVDLAGLDSLPNPSGDGGGWLFCWWPIDDAPRLPPLLHLVVLAQMLAQHLRAGGSVLCHCAAGINRASLVNGQVLHELYPDWTGQQIIERIRARRPGALSNGVFADYLSRLAPSHG